MASRERAGSAASSEAVVVVMAAENTRAGFRNPRRAFVRLWYSMPPAAIFGGFGFVMATGIVSIAAGLVGLGVISSVLFGLNLLVYPLVCAALVMTLLAEPFSTLGELRDCPAGPRQLTKRMCGPSPRCQNPWKACLGEWLFLKP